ncbi:uncharacterized protein LOC144750513 [Ciona intestinalis]
MNLAEEQAQVRILLQKVNVGCCETNGFSIKEVEMAEGKNNAENVPKDDDVTNDDVTPDDDVTNDDVTKDDVTPKDEIADVSSSAPEDQTSEEPGMGNGEETPVVPDVAGEGSGEMSDHQAT